MPEATLTSKGQITIPKEVRDALHVDAGDRLQFLVRDDGVVELRPRTVDLRDLYGVLSHEGKPVSAQDMDAAIGDAIADSFRKSLKK
jgi:AbrB family looped-hinge helix DNA binding protein